MGRLKEDALACANRYTTAMTLGDLIDKALDVFCWCNRCGHNAVLEARMLAGQMGAAQAVPEVGARLRCSGCASKDVATRPAWPSEDPVVSGQASGPFGQGVIEDRAA